MIKLSMMISLIVVMGFLIFINLPYTILRKTDIEFGNMLIVNIENFKIQTGALPYPGDWKLLKELGFRIEFLGTSPTYQKINDSIFELGYPEGFDGPYLLWNSGTRDWKMGQPQFPDREIKGMNSKLSPHLE